MTTRSKTTQRTATRRELERALSESGLTREEELVLRMRAGLTVSDDTPLEYRGTGSDEVAARLAMMEAQALRQLGPAPMVPAAHEGEALKRSIIDRLKKL